MTKTLLNAILIIIGLSIVSILVIYIRNKVKEDEKQNNANGRIS